LDDQLTLRVLPLAGRLEDIAELKMKRFFRSIATDYT